MTGDEIVLQLMECCCEQLRRDHHRTFPKGEQKETVTETDRLKELKQLCVRKKNRELNSELSNRTGGSPSGSLQAE